MMHLGINHRYISVVQSSDGPRVAELYWVAGLEARHHEVIIREVTIVVAAESHDLSLDSLRSVHIHTAVTVIEQVQFYKTKQIILKNNNIFGYKK